MTKPRQNFPNWLRRIDPTLSAEDTNPIFQAFQDRKWGKKTSAVYDQSHRMSVSSLLPHLPWIFAAIILIILMTVFMMGIGFFLSIAIISISVNIMMKTQTKHSRMPASLNRTFSSAGVHSHFIIDLWTTGIKGGQIVEAIYLEKRLLEYQYFFIIYILPLIVFILSYSYIRLSINLMSLLFCISILFGYWQIFRIFQASRIKTISEGYIQLLLENWTSLSRSSGLISSMAVNSLLIFFSGTYIVCLTVMVFTSVLFRDYLANNLPSSCIPYIFPDRSYLIDLFLCLLFFGLGLSMYKLYNRLNKQNIPVFENVKSFSDFAFDRYVSMYLMKDPDGEKWVLNQYGLTQSKKTFRPIQRIFMRLTWSLDPGNEMILYRSSTEDQKFKQWVPLSELPISQILQKEIIALVKEVQILSNSETENKSFEKNNLQRKERDLLIKLQHHLGPNYRIVYKKSVL